MAVLLFEGDEDLKIHTADLSDNTVKIVVENHTTDATNIYTEHKLDLADLRVLEEWISEQRRGIEKNTNK